jgi:hypothetical protein
MQAIVTKFIGPTNTKGARIKAVASAGSVTVSFEYGMSHEERHQVAAKALCAKFGWPWDHISGSLPDGSDVWVKVDRNLI